MGTIVLALVLLLDFCAVIAGLVWLSERRVQDDPLDMRKRDRIRERGRR